MKYISNKTETSLLALCTLVGIETKHGWKKKLAAWWGIRGNLLSTWIDRDDIPENRRQEITKKGHPENTWWIIPVPYPEIPEHILPPEHVKTADSVYGVPGRSDIENHRVVRVVAPDNQWYVNAVTEVLNSNEPAVSEALKANIRQFREQVEDKKTIRKMQDEINTLKTEVKRAANFDCGPVEPADDVEEGGGQ